MLRLGRRMWVGSMCSIWVGWIRSRRCGTGGRHSPLMWRGTRPWLQQPTSPCGIDVTAPLVSIALPVNNAVVASPVTLSGTASDAGGVAEVRVEVFDRDTSKWWGGDGVGWLDDRTQVSASLDAPVGSTDVGWEYVFDLDGSDPARRCGTGGRHSPLMWRGTRPWLQQPTSP